MRPSIVACDGDIWYPALHVTAAIEIPVSSTRTKPRVRSAVAERVHKHRAALRAAGLRPIQIWVPDVRSKSFARQAHKQSLAVARSSQEQDDLAFIESLADWNAT